MQSGNPDVPLLAQFLPSRYAPIKGKFEARTSAPQNSRTSTGGMLASKSLGHYRFTSERARKSLFSHPPFCRELSVFSSTTARSELMRSAASSR